MWCRACCTNPSSLLAIVPTNRSLTVTGRKAYSVMLHLAQMQAAAGTESMDGGFAAPLNSILRGFGATNSISSDAKKYIDQMVSTKVEWRPLSKSEQQLPLTFGIEREGGGRLRCIADHRRTAHLQPARGGAHLQARGRELGDLVLPAIDPRRAGQPLTVGAGRLRGLCASSRPTARWRSTRSVRAVPRQPGGRHEPPALVVVGRVAAELTDLQGARLAQVQERVRDAGHQGDQRPRRHRDRSDRVQARAREVEFVQFGVKKMRAPAGADRAHAAPDVTNILRGGKLGHPRHGDRGTRAHLRRGRRDRRASIATSDFMSGGGSSAYRQRRGLPANDHREQGARGGCRQGRAPGRENRALQVVVEPAKTAPAVARLAT
jgi:hypothetical protein